MPGFDRTGPMGQGARTGRGLGYCASAEHPRMGTTAVVYGVGRGGIPRGGGRGFAYGGRQRGGRWRCWQVPVAPAPMTKAEEVALLQEELNSITVRLDQLRAESDKE